MRNEKAIIHCCVERDVYELLSAHCERTGQTKTTAVKRAIKAYCEPVVNKAAGQDEQGGGDNG